MSFEVMPQVPTPAKKESVPIQENGLTVEEMQKKIDKLTSDKEGILAWRASFDGRSNEDGERLQNIEEAIENLERKIAVAERAEKSKDAFAQNQEQKQLQIEKEQLFRLIEKIGGAYSPTHDKTIPAEEIQVIIEKVLVGELDINYVPRSVIYGREENLREIVAKMKEGMCH